MIYTRKEPKRVSQCGFYETIARGTVPRMVLACGSITCHAFGVEVRLIVIMLMYRSKVFSCFFLQKYCSIDCFHPLLPSTQVIDGIVVPKMLLDLILLICTHSIYYSFITCRTVLEPLVYRLDRFG